MARPWTIAGRTAGRQVRTGPVQQIQTTTHQNNPLDHCTLGTYIERMQTFIELRPFATVRDKYLNDDEFAVLQHYLTIHLKQEM
jgi:hypothetical protein